MQSTSPFAHLRGRANATGKASPFAGLFRKPPAPVEPAAPPANDTATLARQIIAAAAKARGEKSPDAGGSAATVLTGQAREIVDAAALRDAGGPERQAPTNLIARQIIAAGQKRRGESSGR